MDINGLFNHLLKGKFDNELTEKAEEQAIHIFSENLTQFLLQPPLKGKVVLVLTLLIGQAVNWLLLMKQVKY